jgi:hypothetical protein
VKRILVLVAVVATALVLSSAALPANGLQCAHGSTCSPATLGGGTPNGSGSGTLPFTGVDLAGVAAVGGLLLVSGLILQRASRRRR